MTGAAAVAAAAVAVLTACASGASAGATGGKPLLLVVGATGGTGVKHTIVRPGSLNDDPGGQKGIRVLQGDPPEVVGQIPRADVAAVLVNAVGRKEALGRTFEIISESDAAVIDWDAFFAGLKPDVR